VGAIPWTFFFPPIVSATRGRASADSLTRYCVCWFVTSFLFFSACGGKLPTYILPTFPALAVLVADALFEYPDGRKLRWCCLAGIAVLATAVAAFFGWLYSSRGDPVLREHLVSDFETIPLCASVLAALICLGFAGREFGVPGKRVRAIGLVALSLCAMFAAGFWFLPEAIEDTRSPSRLIESTMPLTPLDALIVTDHVTLPSVCWHYGHENVLFYDAPGELRYGVEHASDAAERYAATVDDADLVIQNALGNGRPVAIVVREPDDLLTRVMNSEEPDEVRRLSRFTWALYE
ncbi:MAG: hypothetical protein LBS30_06115, partial [Planctomycetota bacterium]|nr:hypothetical protein [Planctomycetota bacterium]